MQIISLPSVDIAEFLYGIIVKIVEWYPTFVLWVKQIVGILIGLSLPVSLFFFIGIVYCVERLKVIRRKESQIYDLKTVPAYEDAAPAGNRVLAKLWDSVKEHISSDNPNDWRQAIIDADIILDDILNRLGYRGESVGEKLKRVAKGDFATLDRAWGAHKVRNDIAHQGSGFKLTHHDAKAAIDNYRKVFEEFYYV